MTSFLFLILYFKLQSFFSLFHQILLPLEYFYLPSLLFLEYFGQMILLFLLLVYSHLIASFLFLICLITIFLIFDLSGSSSFLCYILFRWLYYFFFCYIFIWWLCSFSYFFNWYFLVFDLSGSSPSAIYCSDNSIISSLGHIISGNSSSGFLSLRNFHSLTLTFLFFLVNSLSLSLSWFIIFGLFGSSISSISSTISSSPSSLFFLAPDNSSCSFSVKFLLNSVILKKIKVFCYLILIFEHFSSIFKIFRLIL